MQVTFSSISGKNIPHGDQARGATRSDPYVRFVLLHQDKAGGYQPIACRTQSLPNTDTPSWPDTLSLTLPPGTSWEMRATVWDADTKSDDDALGTATFPISLAASGKPKSLIMKGLEQAGMGGYKFPNFSLSMTYTIQPASANPLLACLRCCFPKVAADAVKETSFDQEVAAVRIQRASTNFLQRKRETDPNAWRDKTRPPGVCACGCMQLIYARAMHLRCQDFLS